uniref:RHS repeat-associated core domain-containing protein n=1 Tax=Oceanospirillum beijerinckii TaxID=64976 RepID=UPI0006859B87
SPDTQRYYQEEAANDPVTCDLRYQGQIYDSETGLYYNRFRYYDPEIAQYLTPDPIGMAGGLRPQAYVHNPVDWVDPLGLSEVDGSGRPLSSPHYSIWYQTEIPSGLYNASRPKHFQNANEQLYYELENNPELKAMYPDEVVKHVQPGPRGKFNRNSPPNHTWHHNSQDPTKVELIPRAQHKAPGPVQQSLHPKQEGGFKKLQKNCS